MVGLYNPEMIEEELVAARRAELAERSDRVANALRAIGARRGDRLLLMLPNVAQTWETVLACMKLGVVVVPATPQLTPADLADRFERGGIAHVVTDAAGAPKFAGLPGGYTRLVVGADVDGWTRFEHAYAADARFVPDGETRAGRRGEAPCCPGPRRRPDPRNPAWRPQSGGSRDRKSVV